MGTRYTLPHPRGEGKGEPLTKFFSTKRADKPHGANVFFGAQREEKERNRKKTVLSPFVVRLHTCFANTPVVA